MRSLLDRIRLTLEGPGNHDNIVDDVFGGGSFLHKITCSTCKHESARNEPFLTIPISLRGASTTLEDGLQE